MNATRLATAALLALACAPVQADDRWALCPAWSGRTLPVGPDAGMPTAAAPLRIEADRLDSAEAGESLFEGRVLLHHADRTMTADRVRHGRDENVVRAEGEIRYADEGVEIAGHGAWFDLDADRVRFEEIEFRLFERRARGRAASLEAAPDEPIEVRGVRFTTCPAENEAWLLRAPRIELDADAGVGTGRNVRLDFMGVPIFYAPWISFPLTDERKSGFLVPDVGRARNTGIDVRVPWYWNIAPNRDATITPRWMEERGMQIGTEYRYLYERHHGQAEFDVMPEDRRRGESRTRAAWWHASDFAPGWQFDTDIQYVSDRDYYEDLAGGLERTVVTHLPRSAMVSYHGDAHALLVRADGWQTIDRDIAPVDEPYSRLPQLLWRARWPGTDHGPQFHLDAEAVNFHSDDDLRLSGLRFDMAPSATWIFDGPAWFVVPRATWRHTRYQLDGGFGTEDRSLPILSVDSGLLFERDAGGDRIQTLEPRVYWLKIPYRDQDMLPLFDTSRPDFNLVQLFADNRFNGADRIGDTHQAAVGIGSRVFSTATGASLMALQVGRIRFFEDRVVTLPGETPDTSQWSDYVGEATVTLSPRWSSRVAMQYAPGSGQVERSLVQFRWHPAHDRLLNVGWRFRRDQIDQTDVSFAWPLTDRWSAFGRWNWSVDERRNIETFLGFEYQSCCWALRVVSREYIATRAGDTSHSLYLQLELKGLANVGRGTEGLLERGILGYSARR